MIWIVTQAEVRAIRRAHPGRLGKIALAHGVEMAKHHKQPLIRLTCGGMAAEQVQAAAERAGVELKPGWTS